MVELFIDGGGFMWPILGIFIVGLVFVGERLIHLISTLKWGEDFAFDITDQLEGSGVLEAQTKCEQANGPIANLFLVGLENINSKKPGEIAISIIARLLEYRSNILNIPLINKNFFKQINE